MVCHASVMGFGMDSNRYKILGFLQFVMFVMESLKPILSYFIYYSSYTESPTVTMTVMAMMLDVSRCGFEG